MKDIILAGSFLNDSLYKTRMDMENNCVKNPRSKESCSVDVICDMSADLLTSTYSNAAYNDSNLYPYSVTSIQVISILTFSDCDILMNLKSLKISFRPGPDGVSSCILNRGAASFIIPLVILFKISINYYYLPVFWKDSYIPLF